MIGSTLRKISIFIIKTSCETSGTADVEEIKSVLKTTVLGESKQVSDSLLSKDKASIEGLYDIVTKDCLTDLLLNVALYGTVYNIPYKDNDEEYVKPCGTCSLGELTLSFAEKPSVDNYNALVNYIVVSLSGVGFSVHDILTGILAEISEDFGVKYVQFEKALMEGTLQYVNKQGDLIKNMPPLNYKA